MKRNITRRGTILSAVFAALSALIPESVRAAFGIFQVNGPIAVVLPSGVALQQIDGGPTYYASNSFTKATAFPSATFPFNGIAYNGWDDPRFFPFGPILIRMDSQSDATRWVTLGLNTGLSIQTAPTGQAGQLDLFLNNGISFIAQYQALGSILLDRNLGVESVGIYTYDEPTTNEQAISVPVLGNPASTFTNCSTTSLAILTISGTVTGGPAFAAGSTAAPYSQATLTGAGITGSGTTAVITGYGSGTGGAGSYGVNFNNTTSGITITQAAVSPLSSSIIGGRFLNVGLAAISKLLFDSIASATGNISLTTFLQNTYSGQDGRTRFVEMIGGDIFFFPAALDTVNGYRQNVANYYDQSIGVQSPLTIGQTAKGPHYGNMIDYFRALQTTHSIPIWPTLDCSNANTAVAYDTQPVEMSWSSWSSIIHGARALFWFPHNDASSPSGCTGATQGDDNYQCPYFQSPISATFTGSIVGTTLTATSVTGVICPGMVASSGVTGGGFDGNCVILQQTNNFTTPGKAATYTISGGSGSGSMTFTQSNVGIGGIGASGTFQNVSLNSITGAIGQRIRDLAPVINSSFAVVPAGQTIGPGFGYVVATSPALAYVFPSNTGVKGSTPPQSYAYGLAGSSGTFAANAIDCCAKYYTGLSYTASTGDTINPAFYIFATTRLEENHAPNISVSFTINDPLATSIRVIGENRNINFTSGQGTNAAIFSDAFDYAWTTRIYRVNH